MNEAEAAVPQGQQVDVKELLAIIGEAEVMRRKMGEENQRLREEIAALRAEKNGGEPVDAPRVDAPAAS